MQKSTQKYYRIIIPEEVIEMYALFTILICSLSLSAMDLNADLKLLFEKTKKTCALMDPDLKVVPIAQKQLELLFNLTEKARAQHSDLQKEIDIFNCEQLKKIIYIHQWPCIDTFGKNYDEYGWIIVQRADHDQLFQLQCLLLLRQLSNDNKSSKKSYAHLYDHLATNLASMGIKQRYGTQLNISNQGVCTIAPCDTNHHTVNTRRAKKGLISTEDFLAKINYSVKKK